MLRNDFKLFQQLRRVAQGFVWLLSSPTPFGTTERIMVGTLWRLVPEKELEQSLQLKLRKHCNTFFGVFPGLRGVIFSNFLSKLWEGRHIWLPVRKLKFLRHPKMVFLWLWCTPRTPRNNGLADSEGDLYLFCERILCFLSIIAVLSRPCHQQSRSLWQSVINCLWARIFSWSGILLTWM